MSTSKEPPKDLGFPANGSRELQEQLESSTMRIYKNLDETMHKLHHSSNNEKDRAEAEKIAYDVLSHADLPLLFRCRALMILGCSDEPGYVEHAREAVRFAELAMANSQDPSNEADQKVVADCKLVLKQAEEDFEERGGYDEDA